jgi:rRNA maturation RNase YbeY
MSIAEYHNLTIIRQTKGGIPILPFVDIKNAILGIDYDLSLVFPTLQHSTELHLQWKKKPGPVNILSFPLDDSSGEIILTLSQARTEAKKYNRSYYNHLVFLFIHGCLHLKGMTHGAKMEKQERFYCEQFFQ